MTSNVASRTVRAPFMTPLDCSPSASSSLKRSSFGRNPPSAAHRLAALMPPKSRAAAADNRFSLTRADASEQIAYEIRRHIERQGLRPGDRIGTEQELASEF